MTLFILDPLFVPNRGVVVMEAFVHALDLHETLDDFLGHPDMLGP